MKKFGYLIAVLFFASSCNQVSSNSNSAEKSDPIDSTSTAKDLSYFVWEVDFDNKTMKRNLAIKNEEIHVDSVIAGLNFRYKNIPLKKVKLVKDTLVLKIDNSYYLTETMGTFGASQYLAETIINLTSVKNVKFVRLNFEAGSHASPGIWSREDYTDLKKLE